MTEESESTSDDESAFVKVLGSPGKVKILESFLNHPNSSLTASDIANIANISKSTFSRNADLLLDLSIIEVAERVGNTTLYRLNKDNSIATHLAKAQHDLRNKVSDVDPTHWSPGDELARVEDKNPSEAEERVAAIVPQLFTAESESDREELAKELMIISSDYPGAVVEMVPALTELTDDENDTVAESILAVLSFVGWDHPEALDEDDITKIFLTMSTSIRENIDDEFTPPTDRSERYGRVPPSWRKRRASLKRKSRDYSIEEPDLDEETMSR